LHHEDLDACKAPIEFLTVAAPVVSTLVKMVQ